MIATLSLDGERQTLAKAEQDIAEGERRITCQAELIERLRRGGHDLAAAEALLDTLRQTLAAWHGHRDVILRTIERLEGDQRGAPLAGPAAT